MQASRAGRCQRMTKDVEQLGTYSKMITKRWQHRSFMWVKSKVINFHNFRSVTIAKVGRQKGVKTLDTYKYTIDTGSDGNQMPIRIYKMFFVYTNINELNKSINKNSILCL